MDVIGIIGGVGSGKSLLARHLAGRGAELIEADRLGHEVLAEPEVVAALVEHWGQAVLRSDGSIDRAAVAERVFAPPPAGPAELQILEAITHPRIASRMDQRLRELREKGARLAVIDAAVMLKAGWDRFCDLVVYVDAPRELRLQRCLERGWSREQFELREAAQIPLAAKRARADITIDNSGSRQAAVNELEKSLSKRGILP